MSENIRQLMVRVSKQEVALIDHEFVFEDLLVVEHPHCEETVDDWCPKQSPQANLIGRGAKHRRSPVRVRHHGSLHNIEAKQTDVGNREQDWNACTEQEGDVCNDKDVTVLVRKLKRRTRVDFFKGLWSLAVRVPFVSGYQSPLIPHTVEKSNAPEHKEFKLGPVQVCEHDLYDQDSNVIEPECIEIRVKTIKQLFNKGQL